MGFRFRRSIRLAPGLRLNLSRTGLSASLGRRGATVNLNANGARTTVGLPGSGLSYTTPRGRLDGVGWLALVILIGLAVAWLVG